MSNKDYHVSALDKDIIKNSVSKSLPIVIAWLCYALVCAILKLIFVDKAYDLEYIIVCAGVATFAYMGLEYTDTFIKNKSLPSGLGKVENINRYAALVWAWVGLSIFFTVLYFAFDVQDLPHVECALIAGTLSSEYVAGNKVNKIATTMDGASSEATDEENEGE